MEEKTLTNSVRDGRRCDSNEMLLMTAGEREDLGQRSEEKRESVYGSLQPPRLA